MEIAIKCTECLKEYPKDDLVNISGKLVCAICKPIALQRVEENALVNENFKTAHFGIRFGAVFIDGIILWVVGFALGLLSTITENVLLGVIIVQAINFVIGVTYHVYLNGRFGATVGKMVCKIKIIRMNGEPIGYGLSLGRYFAAMISGLILFIGYLMAAFDKKYAQTLHDKMCNTRVVYV